MKTSYTTPNQNSVKTDPNVPSPVMKRLKTDELLEVMGKIWTTLSLSQKEALVAEATRAWYLNQAIEAFRATPTEA